MPDKAVQIPGSKSLTHRALIIAALADGQSLVKQPLMCEDTILTMEALKILGARIESQDSDLLVQGTSGKLAESGPEIFLKNSGTSMRLLASVASLSSGSWILTGSERMQSRPIEPLLESLATLGVKIKSTNNSGCPPIQTMGGGIAGGKTTVAAAKSSQYLSSLLLSSPYAGRDVTIEVSDAVSSWPYVELTLDMMEDFGVEVERRGKTWFKIPAPTRYTGREIVIEGDCSSAAYFWAAAAVTGTRIVTENIKPNSIQPDFGFLEILSRMGCQIETGSNWVAVQGGPLHGIDVDMNTMPDQVPTLAIIAALAKGTTTITNVAHLKYKESDRLSDLAHEMRKAGARVTVKDDGLVINGGNLKPAQIDPHDDHRLAMSFAVAGLLVPGIEILDQDCVAKSFPTFWDLFEGLAS